MKVLMVGCSHHNSPVRVRERLAFSPAQAGVALARLHERFPGTEAVLLSTCNRVEIYTAVDAPHGGPNHQEVVNFLADFHGLPPEDVFDALFERTGEDVVRHLFVVAASLDSMVVGEPQILAQVKQAYELAQREHTTGPLTNSIFQAALRVAKRVATETSINQKRVSIPSVAVGDFAKQIFERFDDKRCLLIGAGEMAEETLPYLRAEGVRDITIVNRNLARAEDFAKRLGVSVLPWDELPRGLTQADLVVSTTGAEQPVVTLPMFRKIEAARYQRPLFVLDLAIPRDFEPAIGDCLGVYLYTIDDLSAICERNRDARQEELPIAQRIIDQETERFMSDLYHRATGPTIRRLRENCVQLKDEELQRLFNRLPAIDAATRAEISQSFERLVNKVLHPPLESLRDEAQTGTPHALLDALKRLFQLRD
jgi:glutamyl-tRNA reductase